jgi:multidrug efflux pump subunit AcrA (membrane-fusion protein)
MRSRWGIRGIILAGALVVGCSEKDDENGAAGAKTPREAVPVRVAAARTDGVQRSVEIVGTLFGQEDVTISNKVPGKDIAIYKDVGDRVAPGEPLAQLLQNDYQLSLNEKQSQLQEVLASLGLKDVPPDSFDLEGVPAVQRARLQAQNAKAKLERAKQLQQSKPPLISEQEFSDIQTESQVAQSGYDAALLEARSQVGTARTRKAQVAIAEQALRDTTIRAPRPAMSEDGRVAAPTSLPTTAPSATTQSTTAPTGTVYAVAGRFSSEGELNAALTRMYRLVIDDPLKLRASVPERHVSRLKVGQHVLIRVEADARAFAGTVSRINPAIDAANRTFEIEIAIPNADHTLKPGAFARGEVQTSVEPDVLLVPEAGVVSFAGVKKVYTVKDGKAAEVPIDTGARVNGWVEVVKPKGMKAGDPVIVEGVNRLAAGVPVQVK